MTTASDYLAKQQKAYPPRYAYSHGLDRAQRLYQYLAPVLPPRILELFASGLLAVGEVGRNNPDVATSTQSDGSVVIQFNSGMIDFVEAVARGLAGLFVMQTASGNKNAPALTLQEAALKIAGFFREWKWPENWLWIFRPTRSPQFALTDHARKTAEADVTRAQLFMLAHELGHVVLEKKILPPFFANTETNADITALKFVTDFATRRGEDHTPIFAGAVLAIRIFAGLEKVGVCFTGEYPDQAERIANISAYMLSLCPSKQYFHEISRIAVAYQDMMDSVESIIVKRPCPVRPDAERIIPHLIAALLAAVQNQTTKERLIARILAIAEQTPADIKRQVADTLHQYYVAAPQDETLFDDVTKGKMGALIVEVLPELPEQVRVMFEK